MARPIALPLASALVLGITNPLALSLVEAADTNTYIANKARL